MSDIVARGQGLDVYFHCCGAVAELIPDLIECGVDMLNLGQPNLFDIEELGRRFGGRVCFVMPVSYQTTSISGTREDIFRVVRSYGQHLAGPTGGLIGYIEEYGPMPALRLSGTSVRAAGLSRCELSRANWAFSFGGGYGMKKGTHGHSSIEHGCRRLSAGIEEAAARKSYSDENFLWKPAG